eukprot:1150292-Pelagomonas_calceolata.AAC.1
MQELSENSSLGPPSMASVLFCNHGLHSTFWAGRYAGRHESKGRIHIKCVGRMQFKLQSTPCDSIAGTSSGKPSPFCNAMHIHCKWEVILQILAYFTSPPTHSRTDLGCIDS